MKEWEKKAELIKVLGVNQKAGVKVGEEIEHPIYGFKTRVVAIYKDLLGNERILTEHAKKHVERKARVKVKKSIEVELRIVGLRSIRDIVSNPDIVIKDTHQSAIIYIRKITLKDKDYNVCVVVGLENQHYIYTVQPMSGHLKVDRYIKLYEREAKKR